MLPRFPAGKGMREIGSKRKGKRGKEEFLKGKCNQGHNIASLVSIDGRGDENAFSGSSGTCCFLLGVPRSGFGTLTDTTAFDSAVFLFAEKHHSGLRLFLLEGRKFGEVNWCEAVAVVELIKLTDGSLVTAFAKFLPAFLEDELLGKRSAVAANAAIDVKDQLCEGASSVKQLME